MQTEVHRLKKNFTKAILWLLFLLVMATGSTCAWFSLSGLTSTNVTPMGGTISKGGSVLLISTSPVGPFEKTCELVLTGNPDALGPVSTGDLQHFYRAIAQNKNGISVLYANADAAVDEKTVHGTVYLKCENAACYVYFNREDLRLGTDSQVLASMRLGMRITSGEGTKTYIWNLDSMGNTQGAATIQTVPTSGTVVASIDSVGQASYIQDPAQNISSYMAVAGSSEGDFAAGQQSLLTLQADEVATVEYWLYLEGCDDQCFNEVQQKNSELQLAFAGVDVEEGAGR